MPRKKKRIGNQIPTFEVAGDYARSDANACIRLFKNYGFELDKAQKHELELFMAKTKNGLIAFDSVSVSKPRQNGKSYAARLYAIWCAAICGMDVVYSAHNADTVDEFFRMVLDLFSDTETYPDLEEILVKSYKQPGKQYLLFDCGRDSRNRRVLGSLRFSTRTSSKARGSTRSVIVVDEAQELTESQLNAMLPTKSASKTGESQTIYIGTPPDPACKGTVFKRMHDTAHSERPGSDVWLEWAVERIPDSFVDEDAILDLAYMTNPALGVRISERAVKDELHKMTPDGFARERLGWWTSVEQNVDYLIQENDWNACLTEKPLEDGRLSFGVKFSVDGKSYAISAALSNDETRETYVELVDIATVYGNGKNLAEWLLRREESISSVVIDGRAGADTLARRLLEGGFVKNAVVLCSPSQAIASASLFIDEVSTHSIKHIASPALDESVIGSIRRPIGVNGGFGFGDSHKASCTAAESAALALYGVRTVMRDPNYIQEVW